MDERTSRAWREIDLEAVAHNANALQSALAPGCGLMAVVKADAYGHGALPIARRLEREGVAAFAVAYRIRPTVNLIGCIPVVLLVLLLTFACGVLVAHFGVYINDLYNVVQVILRFMFYLSGVFYDVSDRLSQTTFLGFNVGRMMITVNPVAYVIDELRKIIIYGQPLRIEMYIYWLVISLILLFAGLKLMYRFENSYIKVV